MISLSKKQGDWDLGQEIERKFLVLNEEWREASTKQVIRQGYLNDDPERTVRVRTVDDKAVLTIKSKAIGLTRSEFEYQVPADDAKQLLKLCSAHQIEKTRHLVKYAGKTWEVDEFHGANQGLVVAEIELQTESEAFAAPPWLGEEVTADPRYFNSYLSKHAYSTWPA